MKFNFKYNNTELECKLLSVKTIKYMDLFKGYIEKSFLKNFEKHYKMPKGGVGVKKKAKFIR